MPGNQAFYIGPKLFSKSLHHLFKTIDPESAARAVGLGLVEEEIARNRDILNTEQIADYYRARDYWRCKLAECDKQRQ